MFITNENESEENMEEGFWEEEDASDMEDGDALSALFAGEDGIAGPGDLLRNLWRRKGERDLSFLNDDDDEEVNDEDGYHNKSADLARSGRLKEAVEVCRQGLEKFPMNKDLLADIIKYSADIGDYDTSEIYLGELNEKIPRKFWNWRAFTFVLDYLLKNPVENEEICREIIADYQKYLPREEKAFVAESELEEKLGNHERSKEILENTIKNRFNAPQSALRLLDIQMQQGEFEQALRTSNYFAIASCEAQPSANQNYQLYMRCLAEDAMLHKQYYEHGSVSEDEVERIRELYDKLLKIPEIAIPFGTNIKSRLNTLDFIIID